jgi:hypothetical protein
LKDFGSDGDVNLQTHSILSPALRSEGGWWNRRVAGLAGQVYMQHAHRSPEEPEYQLRYCCLYIRNTIHISMNTDGQLRVVLRFLTGVLGRSSGLSYFNENEVLDLMEGFALLWVPVLLF